MATVFGVLLLVGGVAVLAVVRPWQQPRRARRRARLDDADGTGRRTRPDNGAAPARPARARGSVPVARASLTRPKRRMADRQSAAEGPLSADRRPRPSAGRRDPEAGDPGEVAAHEPPVVLTADEPPASPGPPARWQVAGEDPLAVADETAGRDVLVRRHHTEALPRVRRVPSEPGRADIELPHWLGPVSSHRG